MTNAYYLYRYLLTNLPREYSKINIILCNFPHDNKGNIVADIEVGYRIVLEKLAEKLEGCSISICRGDCSIYKSIGMPIEIDNLSDKDAENLAEFTRFDDYALEFAESYDVSN